MKSIYVNYIIVLLVTITISGCNSSENDETKGTSTADIVSKSSSVSSSATKKIYLMLNIPLKVEKSYSLIKEDENTQIIIEHYEKTGEKFVTLVTGKAYLTK